MVVLIGKDNRCVCTCADRCVNGKTGSEARCTKEEIEQKGHRPERTKVSDVDWGKVESFEFENEIYYPKSININKYGYFLDASNKYGDLIRLESNSVVTNIKYKNNERSIKVPRRDSKVKGNTRVRGVAISSRASRAKCKRGNF